MPNSRPSHDLAANLQGDAPLRPQGTLDEIERTGGSERLGAMRDRVAPAAASQYEDAGEPDPVLVALLLPAVGEAPRDQSASVWDDTDIVHVVNEAGTQVVGDWNGDGRDTVGVTSASFTNTTFDDEAASTLLDLGKMGAHEPLGLTIPLGSGDDSVEVEAVLDKLDGPDF